MAKTVSANERPTMTSVTVVTRLSDTNPQLNVTSNVFLNRVPEVSAGYDQPSISVILSEDVPGQTVIPEDGFTVPMEAAYVARLGDYLQIVLKPVDRDFLLRNGIPHVAMALVTREYTEQEFVDAAHGRKYLVTIELKQPEPIEVLPPAGDESVLVEVADQDAQILNNADPVIVTEPVPAADVTEPVLDEIRTDADADVLTAKSGGAGTSDPDKD